LQEVKSQRAHFENIITYYLQIFVVLESSFVMHYVFVLTVDHHVCWLVPERQIIDRDWCPAGGHD